MTTSEAQTQIGQLALHIAETYEAESLRIAQHDLLTAEAKAQGAYLMDMAIRYEKLAHEMDIDYALSRRQGAEFMLKETPQ